MVTAATLLAALFHQLGGVLVIVVGVGIALRIRSWRDAALIGIVLLVSIGPVLPMARKFESRFAVVVWLSCAVIAVAGFMTIRDRRLRIAMLCVAPLLAIGVNRQTWAREFARSMQMSDESRVFFDLQPGDALRNPSVPPASMNELRWLKETYLRRPAGTQWFYDDIFLCATPALPRRVFSYDKASKTVVGRNDAESLRNRYCRSIRSDASLSASFHRP